MVFIKHFFALAVLSACLFSLFYFRTATSLRIWDDYRVLYVEKSVEEADVLACLEKNGCEEVISLSSQRIPLSSKFIYPQFQIEESAYLEERLGYFTDKSESFNLFYIYEQYSSQLEDAFRMLTRERQCRAGIDARVRFPYNILAICAAVFLFLFIMAAKRRYFLLPGIFPVLLCVSQPFYTTAAAVCLLLFAIFLSNRLWLRKHDLLQVFKNFYIIALTVAALTVATGQSLLCGLLCILTVIASMTSILWLRSSDRRKANSGSFPYMLIFSAEQVPIAQKQNMRYLLLLLLPLLALLSLKLFFRPIDFLPRASALAIEIPTPVSYTAKEAPLPSLDDYFVWAWFTLTFPYRSLHDDIPQSVKEGDQVSIKSYRENGNLIDEVTNTVYTYNDDFRKQLAAYIDGMDYPAIEKFLKEQDWNMRVAYAEPVRDIAGGDDSISLILLLVALGVPLLLCVCYAFFGRVKT